MEFLLERRDGRLCAAGDMTIYSAAAMKEQLLGALGGAAALQLDLSNVAELDTCGLQALLWAKRTAEAAGGSLTLLAPSPAVREVFELCGLASLCGESVRQAA
jgi:anti-sigma B factor antagonist